MVSRRELPAEQLLRDSPVAGASFTLPVMISERLDELVAQAQVQGERTDRRELLGALILNTNPGDAGKLLRRYRLASNRDASLQRVNPADEILTVPIRQPGPRRKSA